MQLTKSNGCVPAELKALQLDCRVCVCATCAVCREGGGAGGQVEGRVAP